MQCFTPSLLKIKNKLLQDKYFVKMSDEIDSNYQNIEIEDWDEEIVISYLYDNIKGFREEDAIIFKKNRIDGESLFFMTEEKMISDGIPRGPASKIAALIDKIKKNRKEIIKEIAIAKPKPKRSYSSYKKLEEVLLKYNINASTIDRLPTFEVGKVTIKDDDEPFSHCLFNIKLWLEYMGSADDKNEAARCQFISVILLAAIRYFKNITILPQMEVMGSENTGRVDYAINKIKNCNEEELICITEGKQSDIKTGIGQNILQLDSALQVSIFIFIFSLLLSLSLS